MKKTKRVFAAALVLCAFLMPAYAGQSGPGVSDHKAWSQIYEKKSQEQEAVIADHTKMRITVGKYYGLDTSPNGTMALAIGREMQGHCDEIVAAAKKLQQELLEFAEWHKNQATKSQTE